MGVAVAVAAGVVVDGGGNCGPPRWRTSCTRNLTRNMDSPGRCESEMSRANDWRQRWGGNREISEGKSGGMGGGLARDERDERVVEMSCSRLVGWMIALG